MSNAYVLAVLYCSQPPVLQIIGTQSSSCKTPPNRLKPAHVQESKVAHWTQQHLCPQVWCMRVVQCVQLQQDGYTPISGQDQPVLSQFKQHSLQALVIWSTSCSQSLHFVAYTALDTLPVTSLLVGKAGKSPPSTGPRRTSYCTLFVHLCQVYQSDTDNTDLSYMDMQHSRGCLLPQIVQTHAGLHRSSTCRASC